MRANKRKAFLNLLTHAEAIRRALEEIAEPTNVNTRCFFRVHKLRDQNGSDPVAWVEQEDDRWQVYFRIQDEPYFWVISWSKTAERCLNIWGYASEYARVYLSIQSEKLTMEEIESKIGIQPTKVYRKGKPAKFKRPMARPSQPAIFSKVIFFTILPKRLMPCPSKTNWIYC